MAKPPMKYPEIAAMTGVPVDTLRWYRAIGKGPRTFRLGRRVVAYEDDVRAWMDEQYAAETPRPAA